MERPFDLILFDNDGTIVDTQDCIINSFQYALSGQAGINVSRDEVSQLIGLTLWDQFGKYVDDKDQVELLVQKYRKHNEKELDRSLTAFEGIEEILSELDDKEYVLGIVTSKLHDTTRRGLVKVGLSDYFPYIQGCDDCPYHKPDPATLEYACAQLEIPPKRVLYVGDSPYDIHAANGAGCKSAAALWGVFDEDDLLEENPDFVLEKPVDILKYV